MKIKNKIQTTQRTSLASPERSAARPQSGRHDTKPEGSRLTTNAITGLKPRRTRYDVTDACSAGVELRVMPGGAKCWYFR
jgi:hypothetical protein